MSGVTNSREGQPLPCNSGDENFATASCFTKHAGGSDPSIWRDPEESPPLLSSSPPTTSVAGQRGTAWTRTIVVHDGCGEGVSNGWGTVGLPFPGPPWRSCTSLWADPLHSPNSSGRPCRGSSMHPELSAMDVVLGARPPMCASIKCTSRWCGRTTQSSTRAACAFVLTQCVAPRRARRTPRLDAGVDIFGRARRGELAASSVYDGFDNTSAQLKRRFLQGVDRAEGTTTVDGFNLGEGSAWMGGAGRHKIPIKLSFLHRVPGSPNQETTCYDGVKMPWVFKEVTAGLLHVQGHRHLNCRTTRKRVTHTANNSISRFNPKMKMERAHMKSSKHYKPHLYWLKRLQLHAQGDRHRTCRAGKQWCALPLCLLGTHSDRGHARIPWLPMQRRWMADVSPPHVHGGCGNRQVYDIEVPLRQVWKHKFETSVARNKALARE